MLIIKNISKKHGTKAILDDVSLHVNQGEIAVLLGSSGVGKSSLLRIVSGIDSADSGTIELDGKLLDKQTLHATHAVGMVFQNFNLFPHLTALENVTLALEHVVKMPTQQAEQTALELLQQYGIADKKDAYPHQLSGGQQQRLAIARAVALKPRVICMDEPTSALDPLLTTHVATLITNLAQQKYSVILATHDMSLIQQLNCTIYLMHAGRIIETAHSDAFNSNPHEYQSISKFVKGIS